ncbi:MAG: nucleotidyltransferase domain-containing protein [Chitinophagaceae bacterium]|nr:nucleotidyltransferase domain-containing protein [Chitinophagaceae bacterium]
MHFTRKKLYNHIHQFLQALEHAGYPIDKVILFGSYAKGQPHEYSDIDLAIWSPMFSDDHLEDKEKLRALLQQYGPIQLHPYPTRETANEDPFIGEIERTGVEILTKDFLPSYSPKFAPCKFLSSGSDM